MSTLNDNNEWAAPLNLGPKINSAKDDISPFIHANGQTLYFASQGQPGFGGYDIYYTEFTDEDPEMIDKRLAKIDKQLAEIDKNIQVAKAKYQEELDEYNKNLELNQNKYKWWMELYTRLMSQYSSGILGVTKQESRKKEEPSKKERRRKQ